MLYDKFFEKDNCGFGLIVYIEGEFSYKVVCIVIYVLVWMQYCGVIFVDGKIGDGCGLLL